MKATQREVEAMARRLHKEYHFGWVAARREAVKVLKWERKPNGQLYNRYGHCAGYDGYCLRSIDLR